jgi:hypothetical protein
MQHVQCCNILVSNQYSFRNGLSTDNAIFQLIESVFKAWNQKDCVAGIFCDLSRAFDCVAHELLVSKLEFYGIRGLYLEWFISYLYDRKQRVELKNLDSNTISRWCTVKQGVPQGSVLGPLLFSIYINDFPVLIKKSADIIMFADDTSLLFTAETQAELLQKFNNTVIQAVKWFQSNQLFLNPAKTNVVQFSPTNVPSVLNIQYDGLTFPQVEVIRFLGLQLDKQINWRNHLHCLLSKLSKACFVLRRLHYVLDIDALKLVYFAYFQSVVKYGIVFWGNSYNLKKVFLLQKRTLRIMLGLSYRSSCKSWFKKLEILTVPCLYIFSLAMFVINNPYFLTNASLHGIDTRQKKKLHKPLYKL